MTTDPGNPSSSPDVDKTASEHSPDASASEAPSAAPRNLEKTRAASTYVFLVVGAIVTLALLIFIVQNLNNRTEVGFLNLSYTLPVGINMLFAALAGAIVPGVVGAVRILQLRRAYKKG